MSKGRTNTCKPSSLHKRMERQLSGIEKHLEVHPNDKMSAARVAVIRGILSR